MFRNYLLVGWRNLCQNKSLAAIKILGLSIGLTICILVFLFTRDELSYDQFHENKSRLYRIVQTWKIDDEVDKYIGTTNSVLSETFAKEIPEIQQLSRVNGAPVVLKKNNEVINEFPLFVEQNFLDVFSFPLIAGNKNSALASPYSLAISEQIAVKYFGTKDAIGKTIPLKINEEFETYTVSAVLENPPQNSTLKADILLPFTQYEKYNSNTDWIGGSLNSIVLLSPHADKAAVQKKMQALYDLHTKEQLERILKEKNMNIRVQISMQPYTEIHLSTAAGPDNGMSDGSKPVYSWILGSIALFILIIACINFVNLSIAQSLKRGKEIGVRKAVGGSRKQLIIQFLSESLLVTLIAFATAISLTTLTIPFFNELAGKKLSLTHLTDGWFYTGVILLIALTALIAGIYPSFVLSSFKPVKVLKGRAILNTKNYLSRALVILQFSLAIILISGTLVFYQQMKFLSVTYLGYNSDDLLRITIPVRKSSDALPALFKAELSAFPGIQSVAARNSGRSISGIKVNGENIEVEKTKIDENFLNTFQIKLLAGRNFSHEFPTDSTDAIIVNESLLKIAGISINDAIGKSVRLNRNNQEVKIIGVVKDFNFVSLKEKIMPLILVQEPEFNYGEIWVKLKADRLSESMMFIQSAFRKLVPEFPYSYQFMNEINAERYLAESKWQRIISIAATIFIVISCMGLLGLMMVSIEYRIKEISIRKVLGAATGNIMLLASRDFLILVIIACIVAAPISYYFLNLWLRDFAYRIDVKFWMLVMPGLAALIIAALTISIESAKAAMTNPAKSLRTE